MITALGGLGLVFNVFHNQKNIRPTDRVAVVGIGGLGHIAIKILNAWGCDVTAISSNAEKENDARMFGASHFNENALYMHISFLIVCLRIFWLQWTVPKTPIWHSKQQFSS